MGRSQRGPLALVTLVALVARGFVAAWGASRFPAAADGTYYLTFAERLARGAGYTWAWPDGAVTYASHYPVGYPALVAHASRIVAAGHVSAGVAMAVNAALGAALAACLYAVLARAADHRGRGLAVAGALVVALHPALVPYTPALMTEGATAALVAAACAAGLASRRRSVTGIVLAGLLLGAATLVVREVEGSRISRIGLGLKG